MYSRSQDGAVDKGLVELGQLDFDDLGSLGQVVEGDLGEHVMLSLVLHAAHQDQPEDASLPVVPASDDLVVHEAGVNLLPVSLLPLVVADQHEGRVETSDELP